MASKTTTSVAERRWLKVLGTLSEVQARLYVAEKAIELGRGGTQPALGTDRDVAADDL